MTKIAAAMKTAHLSPADKATVEKYRKEGEALQKAGKHQEAVTILNKALAILRYRISQSFI